MSIVHVIKESIVFVGTSDLTGLFRGKSVPLARLQEAHFRGVGWVPTNALITCFDGIGDSPYGSLGDLFIAPDISTLVAVDYEDGSAAERFVIGDIQHLNGSAFACCSRAQLARAIERLRRLTSLELVASFEHEFQFQPVESSIMNTPSFSMKGHREAAGFGETLIAALRVAGLKPESFIKEYGADQFEVPVGASTGVRAADQAVMLRELVRATALRFDRTVSFTPLRSLEGVGNGVHVHFSLKDLTGMPVMYDSRSPYNLSDVAGSFVAGILKYLPEFLCLTAPLPISYQRLTPHRWSAAYNNLGAQDREASLRICPVTGDSDDQRASRFNVEYRAADAAASPHLVLAALIHAGAQGIEEKLAAPCVTVDDLSLLEDSVLESRGLSRLPQSLSEALACFESSDVIQAWFGKEFQQVYLALKQEELAHVNDMKPVEQCAFYGHIY
ncbi:MAG: glutamine synthetase family protein [Granulosicoccus sp.]